MSAVVAPAFRPIAARGSARGKVILLGEHSVVYGRRALVRAIGRRIDVSVSDIYTHAPNGNGRRSPDGLGAERLHQVIARAAELLDLDPADLLVHIDSDLPAGVGLGSSAALSVALVRALASFAGAECCEAEICAWAYELERIFHGNPSGIDNTAATHGGLFVFRRGEPPRHLRARRPLPLVVAIGRTPRATHAAVAGVRQRWESERPAYEAIFDRIDALVARAESALAGGRLDDLGAAMDENHRLLGDLGVSTPELDDLVALGRGAGALGAKLTGGGGGGAILCLCAEPAAARRLADLYRQSGFEAFDDAAE